MTKLPEQRTDPGLEGHQPTPHIVEIQEVIQKYKLYNYIFVHLNDFDKDGKGTIEASVGTKTTDGITQPFYELLKATFCTMVRHHANASDSHHIPPVGTRDYRQLMAVMAFQFAEEMFSEVGEETE